MNNHRAPPPPPLPPPSNPPPPRLDLRSTAQVLKRTNSVFFSHLLTFLFLAFLIFIFRSNVEKGTQYVTAFIDRDPSLKALLSRLDISGRSLYSSPSSDPLINHHNHHHHRRRHRRPFLHLTRVGTLDDDFFSGDEEFDRSLFGGVNTKAQPNATFVILNNLDPKLGFSNLVADNGIKVSEIVRSGLSFKLPEVLLHPVENEGDDVGGNEVIDSVKEEDEGERVFDFHFFINGLHLGRRDSAALLFLVCLLSAAYGYVILGFLVTYSWALGIVFVAVVNNLLGRYRSFAGSIWDGSRMGLKKLSGFILMKWAVRDALTQLLGLWFIPFSEYL